MQNQTNVYILVASKEKSPSVETERPQRLLAI